MSVDPSPSGLPPERPPPYQRRMTFVLLALGVVFCAGAIAIWFTSYRSVESRVVEHADGPTKTTTSESRPSDTLIVAMFGFGAAAVFGAAFFGRIKSVELPFAKIELTARSAALDVAREQADAAVALSQMVPRDMGASPAEIAATVVSASTLAAAKVAEAKQYSIRPIARQAVVPSGGDMPEVTQQPGSLPRSVWDQLVEEALQEVAARDPRREGDPPSESPQTS